MYIKLISTPNAVGKPDSNFAKLGEKVAVVWLAETNMLKQKMNNLGLSSPRI